VLHQWEEKGFGKQPLKALCILSPPVTAGCLTVKVRHVCFPQENQQALLLRDYDHPCSPFLEGLLISNFMNF